MKTQQVATRRGAFSKRSIPYKTVNRPFAFEHAPTLQRKLLIISEKHKTMCMDDQQFSVSGVRIEQSLSGLSRLVMGILQ